MSEDTTLSSETTIEQKDINNPDTISICAFDCTEQNVKRCRKCNRPFCIIHCNHISPNFCKECFKDISIVSEKFKRTFDHISDNGQLYVRTEERMKYYLDGPDWPFVTPWISSLSDTELEIIWVFHHYIMKLIEVENDTRHVQKNRTLRDTQVPRLITQTVTKKVTRLVQPDTPETMRVKWEKMGLDKDTIDMMVAAMTGGIKS